MFKITPIQSIDQQIEVAKRCNTEYKDGAFAYAMVDSESGELMGFAQFEITEKGGHLLDLRPIGKDDDYEAMFILGRATMNFIDMCGAHTLSASASAGDTTLLRAIGLRHTVDGELFCDMTGFFDGSHCSGH
jgi:hypothetical protein